MWHGELARRELEKISTEIKGRQPVRRANILTLDIGQLDLAAEFKGWDRVAQPGKSVGIFVGINFFR